MDLHALFNEAFSIVMQLATLTLGYVTVLAWPAAVLILALLYRRPLVNLINRIRKGSGPGFSFEAEALDVAIDAKLVNQEQQDATVIVPPISAVVRPATDAEAEHARQADNQPRDEPSTRPTGPNPRDIPDDEGFYLHEAFEMSEASRARINRNRIEAAWLALQIAARNATRYLDFSSDDLGLSRTLRRLAERGYTKTGPWRVASRLERLRDSIDEQEEVVSDETANFFVSAAENLKDVLYDIERMIQENQSAHRIDPPSG